MFEKLIVLTTKKLKKKEKSQKKRFGQVRESAKSVAINEFWNHLLQKAIFF